jgi:tetratricopeptide (TPR) repeat protein
MIAPVREDVHVRILAALEEERGSREETDRLCYHATRAKVWSKAFGYGRDVARKCIGRSAFADATAHYEIAIDALDKTPHSRGREIEAIDLRTEARLAFMGLGRIADWFDLGKEAERRANAIDDLGRKVAAMSVRAAAQNFYGNPIEAIDTGEQAVELAEKWGDYGLLSFAEYGLGQAYAYAGRYLDSDRMLGRSSDRLTGPQAVAMIGTTVENMLLMCCMMNIMVKIILGERDAAEGFQQLAHGIAERSDRPFDQVVAAYGEAMLLLDRGDSLTAANVLDKAFARAQRYSVRMFVPIVGWLRGVAYLEQERLEEAKAILVETCELSRTNGYKANELRASIALARVLARMGNIRDALEMLRSVVNTALQQGFGGNEAEARMLQAMISPITDAESKAAVVRQLRASIAISSRNGAKPLALKAEAFLSRIVAKSEDVA